MTRAEAEALCAAAEERAAKATPGPWDAYHPKCPEYENDAVRHHGDADDGCLAKVWGGPANADFIASARTDVPALCAALREAWREADAAEREQNRLGADRDHWMNLWQRETDTLRAERDAANARAERAEGTRASLVRISEAAEARAIRAEDEAAQQRQCAERAEALLRGVQDAARAWPQHIGTDAVLRAALATLEKPPTGERR